MAYIKRFETKDRVTKKATVRWQARYRDPDNRQHAKMFDRKADAQHWLDSISGDLARGSYVDPSHGRRLFREYATEWQKAQVHRATTAVQVDSHLTNHVLPHLGHRPLASIRPSEIQAWVKGRSEVLAPATVEVMYRYVSTIFKAAVSDRLIASSPCVGVKLPKVDREKIVPLDTKTVEAIIDAAPSRFRALILMAAGTGLREGELLGLTADNLQMLRRQVEVTQQLVLVPGGPPYLAPPKTKAGRRTVPLPRVVVDALAAHMAEFPPGEQGLIFTSQRGAPVRRNTFNQMWTRTVKRAGVPSTVRFHALRHYYASLLIRHGESVKVVQARLGHASAAETLDTYSHLWPDSEDKTRDAVDGVLGHSEDANEDADEAADSASR